MTVSLLADNDVVIKLAQMDVYDDAIAAIGATTPSAVGSIGIMLRHMGRASEARRLKFVDSREEADRLNDVLQSIQEIEPSAEESALATKVLKGILQRDLDIDAGELLLMVVAICRGSLDIATGDKRALRALPELEAMWPRVSGLRGRFFCLEQIVKHLSEQSGHPRVRQAILKAPHADKTLAYVLHHTSAHGASGFIQGLQLVIQNHIEEPAPGWLKS